MRPTEGAQQVLREAEVQARQLGAGQVGTEHLLLAIAKHEQPGAGLKDALYWTTHHHWISPGRVLEQIEKMHPVSSLPPAGDLLYSSNLRQVLDYAAEEARAMGHCEDVESEHLLLGITRNKECAAARILSAIGVPLVSVRETVVYLLGWMGRIPAKELERYDESSFE